MLIDDAASYVQPISVPKPLTIFILPDDPRNNKTYLAENPNVQVINSFSSQSTVSVNPPDPTIQNKLIANQNNLLSYNASPITTSPTIIGSNSNLLSVNLNTSIYPSTDQATSQISSDMAYMIDSSSPVYLSSETNDPNENNLFSDIPQYAQPQPAVPPPTFSLDTPDNLYIDPTAFSLIRSNADGSVTYNASLQFDDVDMATDYNVRINVAV